MAGNLVLPSPGVVQTVNFSANENSMAIAWDRLLETVRRREADVALLVPGSPPLIRVGETWRALQLPPTTAEEVVALATERMTPAPQGTGEGYAYADFWFGDVAFFRVMAFGFPGTHLLVV